MTSSSCIDHPKEGALVVIREWQVIACNQNLCAATLLNYFIFWHDIKLKSNCKAKQYNNVSEMHSEGRSQDESLYQWHTLEEIKLGILGMYSVNSIRKAIDLLSSLGFVTIHRNPNPKFSFDKTNFFLLDADKINDWINLHYRSINFDTSSSNFDTSSSNFDTSSSNFDTPSSNFDRAITEITSITTNSNFINQEKKEIRNRSNSPEPNCEEPDLEISLHLNQKIACAERSTFEPDLENVPPPPNQTLTDLAFNQPLDSLNNCLAMCLPKTINQPVKHAKNSDLDFQAFLEVYNEYKPPNFARCLALNKDRINALKRFTQEHGDRAMEIFQGGLRFACHDKFWNDPSKKLTLENYLSNGKPMQWYEKLEDGLVVSEQEARVKNLNRLNELFKERGL